MEVFEIEQEVNTLMGKKLNTFVGLLILNYKYILYIVPFITAVYFFWIRLRTFIPLRVYLGTKELLQITIFFGYLLFFPILLLLLFKSFRKYFPFLVIIPLLFGAWVWDFFAEEFYYHEYIESTLILGEQHYYLLVKYSMDTWTSTALFQCNSSDLECEAIYGTFSAAPITLGASDKTNEVYVFVGGALDWIIGRPRISWYYEFLYLVHNFDDNTYYLWGLYNHEQELFEFVLTECGSKFESCEVLPFRYSIKVSCDERWFSGCDFEENYPGWLGLDVDERNYELDVIIDNEIIFSHGAHPRCHVPDCIILGD